MPVKINARTVEKVRYIISLLGNKFEHKITGRGKYLFILGDRYHALPNSFIWKHTPEECASEILRNMNKSYFMDNYKKINHLTGLAYVDAHRQRNEDYLRYLQGVG